MLYNKINVFILNLSLKKYLTISWLCKIVALARFEGLKMKGVSGSDRLNVLKPEIDKHTGDLSQEAQHLRRAGNFPFKPVNQFELVWFKFKSHLVKIYVTNEWRTEGDRHRKRSKDSRQQT